MLPELRSARHRLLIVGISFSFISLFDSTAAEGDQLLESLIAFDCRLFLLINGAHTPFLDTFMLALTNLGNAVVIAPLLVGIIVWKTPRGFVKLTLIFGIIGLSGAGIGNAVLKVTINRPRPVTYFSRNPEACRLGASEVVSDDTPSEIHLVGPTLRYRSFPSGHTNTAFAAAFLLGILYGGYFWLALLPALGVGYTRVYLGVHFPGDVLGGAITGIVFVLIVYHLFKRYAPNFPPPTTKVTRQSRKNKGTSDH